jgi:chromosome segregation ATPase
MITLEDIEELEVEVEAARNDMLDLEDDLENANDELYDAQVALDLAQEARDDAWTEWEEAKAYFTNASYDLEVLREQFAEQEAEKDG